ncbi:MAG: hypothetical protein JWN41_1416, partial [Thermoleophilia bacterium]|nr:hypothetical protein [Thermoleophilia bacterium]
MLAAVVVPVTMALAGVWVGVLDLAGSVFRLRTCL